MDISIIKDERTDADVRAILRILYSDTQRYRYAFKESDHYIILDNFVVLQMKYNYYSKIYLLIYYTRNDIAFKIRDDAMITTAFSELSNYFGYYIVNVIHSATELQKLKVHINYKNVISMLLSNILNKPIEV